MPMISRHQLGPALADVLTGKRRLVVWGALDWAASLAWQFPFPIDYVLDANWKLWGTTFQGRPVRSPSVLADENAGDILILVLYEFGDVFPHVAEFIGRFGDHEYFIPCPLGDIAIPENTPDDGAWKTWRQAAAQPHWDRAARLAQDWRRLTRRCPASDDTGKTMLVLEQFHLGGAERQICNLGVGLARQGHQVVVATLRPPAPGTAHYLKSLADAGVAHICLPPAMDDGQDAGCDDLVWHIPGFLLPSVTTLRRLMEKERPDRVVCYLDRPNVAGGLAALLAGVPQVLMSARNVNPDELPHFYKGQTRYFAPLYRLLTALPGFVLSANAHYGARSYAQWLELPEASIPVIANGIVEPRNRPGPSVVQACRALMGLPATGQVILGIFRLAPEKRPMDFVETMARVVAAVPGSQGVLCGDGMMEADVTRRIQELGLTERLQVVAPVRDVSLLISMADVLLHTAEFEGTPNVVLEAQAGGLPVVTTLSGGTAEVLAPRLLELARPVGDVAGLAASVSRLLGDAKLAKALRRAVRRHMADRHSIQRLAADTLRTMKALP